MNTSNIMEEMLVWHSPIKIDSKHDVVGAIYENHIIIGWCTTWKEADAICDKLSHLQWSKKKKSNLPERSPHLIASILFEEQTV
jgi:hypothetical protein